MSLYELTIRADQGVQVGGGRGSGFSRTTLRHVPASMIRGAIAGHWWRERPPADGDNPAVQHEFDRLIGSVSFSDGVVAPTVLPPEPSAGVEPLTMPLDRGKCKYPLDACPKEGHPWQVRTCPVCGRRPEPGKGARGLPTGASVAHTTRVALAADERPKDAHLYRREALNAGEVPIRVLVDGNDRSLDRLAIRDGTILRLGGSLSVFGRVQIDTVEPFLAAPVTVGDGMTLRVELLTMGVYVDDFGFPVPQPSSRMLAQALGLSPSTSCTVTRAFTRWVVAAGWHAKANMPKVEDPAVTASSVFHVSIAGEQAAVPSVITGLGLRRHEGCGWAKASALKVVPDARP